MIKSFFKLIRWLNLLIILMSMFFLLFFIIRPVLGTINAAVGLSSFQFGLLIIATLFIAIGGYIINDIKDQEADTINKPGKNTVGSVFSIKQASVLYMVFTLIGMLAGSYLSFALHQGQYSLVFIFTAGLLWYYAARYQCQALVGNAVVGFLSALSFGLVWLFEIFGMQHHLETLSIHQNGLSLTNHLVFIYMGFAFMVSLLREIVKDIEDVDGDERSGCLTFAVVYGIPKAKTFAVVVNLLGMAASIWFQWFFQEKGIMLLFWFFFLIDALFIYILVDLIKAHSKSDFGHLSLWIKVLMLAGILSMALFYFNI